jgi:hypothetical protein
MIQTEGRRGMKIRAMWDVAPTRSTPRLHGATSQMALFFFEGRIIS